MERGVAGEKGAREDVEAGLGVGVEVQQARGGGGEVAGRTASLREEVEGQGSSEWSEAATGLRDLVVTKQGDR